MKAVKSHKLPVIRLNKYYGHNVQHDKYKEHCYTLYMKVILGNNLTFFFFFFVFLRQHLLHLAVPRLGVELEL